MSTKRVAAIGNHHSKNQLVNTWEKGQEFLPWVLPSENTHFIIVNSVFFKKLHERMNDICKVNFIIDLFVEIFVVKYAANNYYG